MSTVVNDAGVTGILTADSSGAVYVHARGSNLVSGSGMWGQVVFFAEA